MRKLVLAMFMSLDGYMAGPKGEFIPPPWSGEVEKHWSHYGLARATHLLYGRVTCSFNKEFWSAADSEPKSPAASISYAATMNRLPKTVFSRSLSGDPGWSGKLAGSDIAAEINALKSSEGGD